MGKDDIFKKAAKIRKAMMDSFPGKIERGKYNEVKLSEEQQAWFRENYSKLRKTDIARAMGISVSLVSKYGTQWDLKNWNRRGIPALSDVYGKEYKAALFKERNSKISKVTKRKRKMEMFRAISGMPLKTKWHVTAKAFTSKQTSARHDALKRGYWYYLRTPESSPLRWNIYYDSNTKRSESFEKRIRDNGFNLLEGKGE